MWWSQLERWWAIVQTSLGLTHKGVNTGSCNGLLPGGTKPLPYPMLTNPQLSLGAVTCGEDNSTENCKISFIWVWKLFIQDTASSSRCQQVRLLRPGDAYMRYSSISSLLQIMAWCQFCAKPLSESVLSYCQLHIKEHISLKFFSKFKSFHSRKCTWKCHLWTGSHLSQSQFVNLQQKLCQQKESLASVITAIEKLTTAKLFDDM